MTREDGKRSKTVTVLSSEAAAKYRPSGETESRLMPRVWMLTKVLHSSYSESGCEFRASSILAMVAEVYSGGQS